MTIRFSAVLIFLASACAQPSVVVQNVTVIDGSGGDAKPGQSVLIRDGRIESIEPAASFRVPRGAEIIDGTGRWLMPGLIDMHAHVVLGPAQIGASGGSMDVTDTTVASWSLRTLLAFGVTTIRDPGGVASLAVAVRDSVARGQLIGPRILTAGDIINHTAFPGLAEQVRTPDDVRAAVRRQAGLGVDYIKLYTSLDSASVAAGIDEAHRAGKKVIGHLFATSWTEAAGMGIDYLVHSFPLSPKLLTPERRAAWRAWMVRNAGFMFQWHEFYEPESAEADSMIEALVARRIPHDPTLAIFEAIAWGDSARIIDAPDLVHAPPSMLENWRTAFTLSAGFTPADYDRARRTWPLVRRFVKQLHDRGVLLTTGSDANNPWVPAGPSLHREFELLVEAGIPPREVLRMATRNGAEALGILDQTGTVEVGKQADLLLLDANPEVDIASTRSIVWVMRGGTRWIPSDLLAGRAKTRP